VTPAPGASLAHWEGEPVRIWEELWGVPAFEAWSTIGSTNARARQLAADGAPPWTVVTAEEQTAGRGREGRTWRSEPDRGLWFSLLAPELRSALALVPLRAGAAVVGVLRSLGGDPAVGLKWPNDLWWQDRKIGGILCERDAAGTVIGIGLNLRDPEVGDFSPRPAGLEEVVAGRIARAPLLGSLVASIRTHLERGGPRLDEGELVRLHRYDCLKDRAVRCEPGPGGIARGVGPDGGLRIETGTGVRTLHAGRVRPIGPPPRISNAQGGEEEP